MKDVLASLDKVKQILTVLGTAGQLDRKLAEYAFFPLAQQVFNETKNLSPRCLEVATECVTLLVQYGYGSALQPNLAKQLLILMSMLAGSSPSGKGVSATDELKAAALECMNAILVVSIKGNSKALIVLDLRSVMDQLVYLLLELLMHNPSPKVQRNATLLTSIIVTNIADRVFLSSLLPRTASTLVKVLQPSTKIRRSDENTATHIQTLKALFGGTVSDRPDGAEMTTAEAEALDSTWRAATAGQIHNVLLRVFELRTHTSPAIRHALEDLCVLIIESCYTTLASSLPVTLETLVVLSVQPDASSTQATCRYLLTANAELTELLRDIVSGWSLSLARQMHGQDGHRRDLALRRLSAGLLLLADVDHVAAATCIDAVLPFFVQGLDTLIKENPSKAQDISLETTSDHITTLTDRHLSTTKPDFPGLFLDQEGLRETHGAVMALLQTLAAVGRNTVADRLVRLARESDGMSKQTATWAALQLTKIATHGIQDFSTLVINCSISDQAVERNAILGELHATLFPCLAPPIPPTNSSEPTWQMQAMAMEATVLYAESFPQDSYRPNLMETLYPIMSLMASKNILLQRHAFLAIDRLAAACQYLSAKELFIDNADYLVNAIGWKLNTYNLSPEAPQILRMLILLCGPQLIPYLDDLVASIFTALDSYHGYTQWVEMLFHSLAAIVDVAVKEPTLTLTEGKQVTDMRKKSLPPVIVDDIVGGILSRKRYERATLIEQDLHAPQRPWTDRPDSEGHLPMDADSSQAKQMLDERDESRAPVEATREEDQKLDKSHQLLLDVAQATIPHLASPSAEVRQLLLGILKDVSPLLGSDQGTFLPLINAIWPALVSRLFADENADEETSYNIASAATSVSVLCRSAGDFMSGRIERIMPELIRLFRRYAKEVERHNKQVRQLASKSIQMPLSTTSSALISTHFQESHTREEHRGWRTSQGQILAALIDLFQVIVSCVHLPVDSGEAVVNVLLPFMTARAGLREILESYNADAVWLFDLSSRYNSPQYSLVNDKADGHGHEPQLRTGLQSRGFSLARGMA